MVKIAAIIVLFNNKSVDKLIASLSKHSDLIILVDNTEDSKIINKNKELTDSKIKYIGNGKNEGIAKAQNRALVYLKNYSPEFIFFFDQDSEITNDFQRKMIDDFYEISKTQITLAILAPSIYELQHKENNTSPFVTANEVISSGSLIKGELISKIGLFEEDLFIDYVDFEFCWRAYKYGFSVVRTNNVFMHHTVGKYVYSILGRHIYVPAPFRYFYQYRNGSWLLKRNYVPKEWKRREKKIRILNILFSILIFDSKKERLRYIYEGIKNGKKANYFGSDSNL